MSDVQHAKLIVLVNLDVGLGMFKFQRDTQLAAMPAVGDHVAANGDSTTYEVSSVVVTPHTVYVRCFHPFRSEEEAEAAGVAWDFGSTP